MPWCPLSGKGSMQYTDRNHNVGLSEEEFIRYLGRNHVSIFRFDDKEEFLEELKNTLRQ